MTDKPTPTDAELKALWQLHAADIGGIFCYARAVLAKWGQPAPATQQAGERVYAFRRKGLADFCTCDEARYEELSNKPHLFETRIFYTAPQPVAREPLTYVQINAAGKKMAECMDYPWGHMPEQGRAEMRKHAQAVIEAAHGIKGGQHGTE